MRDAKRRRRPSDGGGDRSRGRGGTDVYRIVGGGTIVEIKWGHPHVALTVAQRLAETADGVETFVVERESLFGPREVVYRVVRDETGTVWTTTVGSP